VPNWTFLTNHGRVLLCIARDPDLRLRDVAAALDITERRAFGIVNDLAKAGYVLKHKEGRRTRYEIQEHLPLPEPTSGEQSIGDVLSLLVGAEVLPDPERQPRAASPEPRALSPSAG
jgi:hypothetical protein